MATGRAVEQDKRPDDRLDETGKPSNPGRALSRSDGKPGKKLFLGMDGGQSSVKCVLADETGRVLARGVGGPMDHLLKPGGPEQARKVFAEAINGALASAREGGAVSRGAVSLPDEPVLEAAFLGLTGVNHGSTQEEIVRGVFGGIVRARALQVENDAVIAWAGATLARPGVAVLAGTGSIGIGVDPVGKNARCGGWGYLIDDAGSGYAIGIAAINASLRAMDRRGEPTTLANVVPQALGCTDLVQIVQETYAGKISRDRVASLTVVVAREAEAGDEVARRIFAKAGYELALLAAGVVRQLSFGDGPVTVCPVGGVFRAGDVLREPFAKAVRELVPRAEIREPALPADAGAALLALRLGGVELGDAVIERLRQSYPADFSSDSK